MCRLERHLKLLDTWSERARSDFCSPGGAQLRGNTYSTEFLLRACVAAYQLHNKSNLKAFVHEHVVPLMPPAVKPLLVEAMEGLRWRIPSWSTSLHLALDVGVMTWQRHIHHEQRGKPMCSRYGFADSSPQGGRDWLVSVVRTVMPGDLRQFFSAVVFLSRDLEMEAHTGAAAVADDPDAWPELPARQEVGGYASRAQAFSHIADAIQARTCVPVALGSGKTALEDKVSALLYAFWLEVGLDRLVEFLESFVSFTSDMGAERGIPDFASVDIREALPKWLVNSQIVEDSGDAQPLRLPFFLPRALPVLGLLHIFANASKDIAKALRYWPSFFKSLKVLEKFICNQQRMRHFIASCLEGKPWLERPKLK